MTAHARELTDTEFDAAIEAAGSPRNRLILQLTHFTGMRIGEVAQLNVKDVLTKDGEIKDLIRLTPKQTKHNWGRDVLLSSKMQEALADYLNPLRTNDLSSPLLTSEKTGRRLGVQSLYNLCRSLYERAGLTGASSHSGRRTFINKMSKQAPLNLVQTQVGHRFLTTTQKYLNSPTDAMRAAIEQL